MGKALTLSVVNAFRFTERESLSPWYKSSSLKYLASKADKFPLKKLPAFAQTSYLFHQKFLQPLAATQASVALSNFKDSDFWLRLDLVQKQADRDTLLMFPPEDLAITSEENSALAQAFNEHFAEEGLKLELGRGGSWFLSLPQAIDLSCTPLQEACYCKLNDLFPSGEASALWRKLINETQMLFFNHPVNLARREAGMPEINSIWVWGEGCLHKDRLVLRDKFSLVSQSLYAEGLAGLTQAGFASKLENFSDWLEFNQDLQGGLVELQLDETLTWDEAWQELEQKWIAPIKDGLKAKKLSSVFLDLGLPKGFLIEPSHLRRFWRFSDALDL